MPSSLILRVTAGVAGLVLGLTSAWASIVVLLILTVTAQTPDPSIPDGDPCCGHPDSWGEVALGSIGTLVAVVLVALPVAGSIACVSWALRGTTPRFWRLAWVAPIVVAALVGAWAALLGPG